MEKTLEEWTENYFWCAYCTCHHSSIKAFKVDRIVRWLSSTVCTSKNQSTGFPAATPSYDVTYHLYLKKTVLQDVKNHPKQVSFPSSGYLNTFPKMLLQAPGLEVPAAL